MKQAFYPFFFTAMLDYGIVNWATIVKYEFIHFELVLVSMT